MEWSDKSFADAISQPTLKRYEDGSLDIGAYSTRLLRFYLANSSNTHYFDYDLRVYPTNNAKDYFVIRKHGDAAIALSITDIKRIPRNRGVPVQVHNFEWLCLCQWCTWSYGGLGRVFQTNTPQPDGVVVTYRYYDKPNRSNHHPLLKPLKL